jgi:hypothetical protein
MVQKVIITMWENNNWDANLLNNYILEKKPTLPKEQHTNIEISTQSEQYTHEQLPPHFQKTPTTPLEETIIEEIEMLENNEQKESDTHTTKDPLEDQLQNIVGNNITSITHYNI